MEVLLSHVVSIMSLPVKNKASISVDLWIMARDSFHSTTLTIGYVV